MSPAPSGSKHWRTGLFKENSRCVRCGRKLDVVSKICDRCVVEIYVLSLLTGEPVRYIARRSNIDERTVRRRLAVIRERGDLPKIFYSTVEDLKKVFNFKYNGIE